MSSTRSRLSPARILALEVLEEVRKARFAEQILSDRLQAHSSLSPEDRGLATELVYGVLRWRDRLDDMIRRCSDHPIRNISPRVRHILRIGLYQIFLLDRIPDHAAVDQAVAQARVTSGEKTAAFVNALLRKALRDRDAVDILPGKDAGSLAMHYSHPRWLVKRWLEEFGLDQTRRLLMENNSRPRIVVRVNTLRTTVQDLLEWWQDRGIGAEPRGYPPYALAMTSMATAVQALPGYSEGFFVVQDSAAQMIAPLVGAQPGDRILDACAAPGGKSSHLAALTENRAKIIALELDRHRLEEMEQNLRRLGVTCVQPKPGDASDAQLVATFGMFDRILVDPPCTNLGVLRRSPEARYRTDPRDPAVFADRQIRLLNATASGLKPAGTLLYSVCTVTREETEGVIDRFLGGHPEYQLDPMTDEGLRSRGLIDRHGFLRTFPSRGKMLLDGFFAARLKRKAR